MITWANLRASAAPWLALPALFYVGLYIDDVTYTAPSGYGVQSGELAAFAVAIIAPAVAGAAAWEAGRHRRLGAMRTTSARRIPVQLLRAAAPVLTLQLVLVAGALVVARTAVGVWPGGTGWLAVAHLVVLPLGWLVIGWCLGLVLPRSIAAPAVGISCWAWLSMPHAMANPWMRHLGGFIDGTSTVTDVREPAVFIVPWLIVAGFALAFWSLAGVRRRPWIAAVGILGAIATFTAGRSLVIDWGYRPPTSPRHVAPVCTGQAPRVCVPPEYEPYAAQLRRDALTPLGRLKDAGIPAPQELRVASAVTPLEPGTWPLFWSLPPFGGGGDRVQYTVDLAESAVSGAAALAGVTDCRQPGSPAAAWAALAMGVDEGVIRQGMLPADWAALQKVRGLPVHEQARWFNKTAVSQKHCVRVVS
ncbi:hypothetical protein EAO71_02725 [Streptomyces sp. ms191]|uniref:DUF7224 domain-containing protein n=1 Tax=Streptomyces sp. ms191 TaxID=1827978 RepID=UPI0011CEAE00|nr:hypothetical protein [Streptomyces sp. ms191]TXS33625.1 hypothetical protein EAO71_02725 [Streptomyces sp. ms191]